MVSFRRILLIVLCGASGAAWGDNLLRNAGFEDDDGSGPAYWNVFIMPMFGAEGVVDRDAAAEGFRSIRLHTPEPYSEEPANNWSQNITAEVAGKELRLEGAIRSSEVDYAGIWIQFCTKRPFRILHQESTYDVHPIKGTRGWTRVSMTVSAPESTEFVIVRCIIQGAGTAWFDDLQLTVEEPPEPPAPVVKQPVAAIAAEPNRPAPPMAERPVTVDVVAPEPPTASAPETSNADLETLTRLVELNRALRDTIEELRGTNTTMSGEIQAHRAEIERLKDEMMLLRDTLERAEEAQQAEIRRVPPLVPGSDPTAEPAP